MTFESLTLEELNELPEDEVRRYLADCCGATRWVEKVASRRPFSDVQSVYRAAGRAADALSRDDWLEAFSHHPRIGEVEELRQRFGERSGGWSEGEQAGLAAADAEVLRHLAAANRRYERRFGYSFIVCATGKGAGETLEVLNERLGNPPEAELAIAAAEQRKITRIRLDKSLDGEAS